MTSPLSRIPRTVDTERDETPDERDPHVGRWYWLKVTDKSQDRASTTGKGRVLVCVMNLGSNFVEVTTAKGSKYEHGTTWRLELKLFREYTEPEPNGLKVIRGEVEQGQTRLRQLMAQVQELTHRLGVSMGARAQLTAHTETAALSLATNDGKPLKDYKKALTKAAEKQLPELFEKIKDENESISHWMKAELLPLQTQVEDIQDLQAAIKGRVFTVELYSGLVETIAKVKDGKPASVSEPLHLFQRRHYMDEECLADYQTGGLHFSKISQFDEWLSKPGNFNRLFPFPRTCVAFQVRRKERPSDENGGWGLSKYISIQASRKEERENNWTFLYFRNGEQLWWLQTEIDFGAKLFPDLNAQKLLTGQLYAHRNFRHESYVRDGEVDVISEGAWRGMRSDEARELWAWRADYRERRAKNQEALSAWPAVQAAYKKASRQYERDHAKWNEEYEAGRATYKDCPKAPKEPEKPYLHHASKPSKRSNDYEPFSREHLYYDEMVTALKKNLEKHNRIVLVLQGVHDRSEALLPHPPVKLWEAEDFEKALRLHYDDSRALVATEYAPDFEAYRRRVNATIGPGSITLGQALQWEYRCGEAKDRSEHGDNRWHGSSRPRHRPSDDPGPGFFAKVVELKTIKGVKHAVFKWQKPRAYSWSYKWGQSRHDLIAKSIAVPVDQLFNVSAYTPGDYAQFYADPRTRADYIKWAGFLLEAEEFHAGNRTKEFTRAKKED